MAVKIFCSCGTDITDEIPAYDKKTRTLHWFESNGAQCASCAAESGTRSGAEAKGDRTGFLDSLLTS
jgi:hypothetical protein